MSTHYLDPSVPLASTVSPWADASDELAIEEAMMSFGLDEDDDDLDDDLDDDEDDFGMDDDDDDLMGLDDEDDDDLMGLDDDLDEDEDDFGLDDEDDDDLMGLDDDLDDEDEFGLDDEDDDLMGLDDELDDEDDDFGWDDEYDDLMGLEDDLDEEDGFGLDDGDDGADLDQEPMDPQIAALDYQGDDDDTAGFGADEQFGSVTAAVILTLMSVGTALGIGAGWGAVVVGGIVLTGAAAGGAAGLKRIFGRNAKYLRKTKRYIKLRKKSKELRKKGKGSQANRLRRRAARLLSQMRRIYGKMKPEDRRSFNSPVKVKRRTDAWLAGKLKFKKPSKQQGSSLSPQQEAQVQQEASQTNYARRKSIVPPAIRRRARLYQRLKVLPTPRLRMIWRTDQRPMVKSVAAQILRERGASLVPQRQRQVLTPPPPPPRVVVQPRPMPAPVLIRPRPIIPVRPVRPWYARPIPQYRPPAPAPTPAPAPIPMAPVVSQSAARRPGSGRGGFGAEPVAGGAPTMQIPPGYELTPTFWGAVGTVVQSHPVKTALLTLGAIGAAVYYADPIKDGISEAGHRLTTPR